MDDTDSGARTAAASVLGRQGNYPEKTRIHALAYDPDNFVRESAFEAALHLGGVLFRTVRKEIERIKSNELSLSLEEVKRVLRDQKLFANVSVLEGMRD